MGILGATIARVSLLPVIAGCAYEILRVGRHGRLSAVIRLLRAPGMALQRLTTGVPDDRQLEVAIAAMQPALGAGTPEPAR